MLPYLPEPDAAFEFWGWCGTMEAMTMQHCFKCLRDEEHPWHDDGTPVSEWLHLWVKGGKYAPPGHVEADDH